MYNRALVFLCFSLLAIGQVGCLSIDLSKIGSPSLTEHEISRDGVFTQGKILIVEISGQIRSSERRSLFGRDTTPDAIRAILNKAAQDDDIKALVLRINSPGGEVTATDVIYHDLRAFRERTGMPVHAAIMSLGTSGAYYIAASANEIYGHPTSIIGSLGVIARIPQYGELADKVGYGEVVFKSGKNKDLGDPLQEIDEEQRVIFQGMIDSMYERFLDVVVENRPGYATRDELRPIADGRIYTPEQARAFGLVDGIAYLDEVIEKAKRAAGLEKAKVITYSHRGGDQSNIYSRLPTQLNLLNIDLGSLLGETQAGFHYLWMPGD